MKTKKALLVISFGSTFEDTRVKDIGGIEAALAAAFPAYDHFRAFTSAIVRKRLAARGIIVKDPETVITELLEAGYEEFIFQPTHLLHGEEFQQKILALQNKFNEQAKHISISSPLLVTDGDYRLVAAAVAAQFPTLPEGTGVVLMGHGTPRNNNKAFHYTYNKMQNLYDSMNLPVVVGTVEEDDYPNLEIVLERVKERGYKHVHLYPLMVVAGDHANNDMYGDEPDSWKNRLEAMGVTTTGHLNGIGRYKAIQALYIHHVLETLAGR